MKKHKGEALLYSLLDMRNYYFFFAKATYSTIIKHRKILNTMENFVEIAEAGRRYFPFTFRKNPRVFNLLSSPSNGTISPFLCRFPEPAGVFPGAGVMAGQLVA